MGVARLYRVGSPYNAEELSEIDLEQTADIMYLAHIDHAPTKLVRHGHTDWEFLSVTFGPTIAAPTGVAASPTTPNTDSDNDGNAYFPQPSSYVVTALSDTSGQESRASASSDATNDLTLKRNYNTITWSAVTGADRYKIYKADNQKDFGYIGTTDGLTFRDDNIEADLSDGPPSGQSPFNGADNYPSTVTFFQQRLMWGRTKVKPAGIWGSKSADFENMDTSRPLKADDALSVALVAGRVNAVNQLVSMSDLLALTSDSLFKINGTNQSDGVLTATQIVPVRQLGRGSSRLGPLVVDNVVFYKPSSGSSVRSIGYQFDIDGYQTNNVSIFSPHLFDGFEIREWAYTQEPSSCIWAVRDDGKLLCFTWEQEQQVWGWTLCETDGLVESVCAVTEKGEDRLYLVVRRTIGGQDVRFIERLASSLWEEVENACYLDCSVSYAFEEPTDTLTTLHHLEGRTVDVLADGNAIKDLVVTNGKVVLPYEVTRATCGLPYTVTIETLPLVVNTQGSNQGKRQLLAKAVARFINTRGVFMGPDAEHLYEVKPRSFEPYGAPTDLINGDVEAAMSPVISGTAALTITQDYPLPLTLTAAFLDPVIAES